jgi:hypothetical protein
VAGTGGTSGRGAILGVMLLVSLGASPVTAAEDPTIVLPGTTVNAITIDLDGDGAREIVRIVQEGGGPDHTVDAWRNDGEGWMMMGSQAMQRATGNMDAYAAGAVDAVALLRWHAADRERLLVLSAGMVPVDSTGATCCLALSELRATPDGDIDLQPIQEVGGGPQTVLAADIDGDGLDEVVLHEGHYGASVESETATVTVLRWAGSAFERAFEMTDRQLLFGLGVGDTDLAAGVDLVFGPGTDGRIRRLAWADGSMHLDEGSLDAGEPREGWIVGVADGAIVLSVVDELRVVRWPRGQAPATVDRISTLEYPSTWLIGDGPDALVAVQSNTSFDSGRPPTVTVHDLALRPLGEVGGSPVTDRFWAVATRRMLGSADIQRNIYPYSGPIYDVLGDDRPGYVSSGMLIRSGGPDGYEARPISSLLGVQPIGPAGPRDEWMAMSDGYFSPVGPAYLYGGGVPIGWGRMAITPLDLLLQPDDEPSLIAMELLGAVETARDGTGSTLMADGDGFQLRITAPAGSAVILLNHFETDERIVGDSPLLVEVAAPRSREADANQPLEAVLLVMTPGGRGAVQLLTGTFVREAPELTVSAATDEMALSATLSGSAGPLSHVTANGVDLDADSEGRFAAAIDAPIWPSQVVVTARDPLGNETTQLIEVVGVVDYRGLPWAAILIAATLVAGGVLFVRTPKRHARATGSDGDGRLEELELDAIEGFELPGR